MKFKATLTYTETKMAEVIIDAATQDEAEEEADTLRVHDVPQKDWAVAGNDLTVESVEPLGKRHKKK